MANVETGMTAAERARADAERRLASRDTVRSPDRDVAKSAPALSLVDHPTPPAPEWEAELAIALADVRGALGVSGTVVRPPLFESCDVVELLQQAFAPTPWLVEGLITRGGITTIGGEPKTSKTWLGTEIAIAVATGTPACGEFFAKSGTVAYFYAEDLGVQVRNRIRALLAGAGRQIGIGRLHARPRGMFLDVTRDEDLAWIVASCRRLGEIDLLLLDPLRDISSAAEDKSDDMSKVMRSLRLLGELLSCTVAIIHHCAKASADTKGRRPGQRLRGSGAIHGSTDSGIYLGDLTGDGSNVFRNVVDSEVKGARSAGRFTLELAIEDDDGGEAVKAVWTVSKDAVKAKKAQQQGDDNDLVFGFVRELAKRGEHLSRRKLRDHDEAPIAERRVREALDRLIEAGRLILTGSVVTIPKQNPWDAE